MTATERYRAAMADVLSRMERAYLASSTPAPHPVRWKRWLRRPYRRVDWRRYMEAMRQ